MKGYKVILHIDRDVTPVAQPVNRLPFLFRDKVKVKLYELVDADMVEPSLSVGGTWVSPLVAVLKDSGEIRQLIRRVPKRRSLGNDTVFPLCRIC